MIVSKCGAFYSTTSAYLQYEENEYKCTPSLFAAILFLHELLRLNSRHSSSCISSQGIPGHDVPACWTLKIYCFALKGNV